MSDLVKNPKDRFSRVAAHIGFPGTCTYHIMYSGQFCRFLGLFLLLENQFVLLGVVVSQVVESC